jgi:molecular chaperone DnaJ
LCGADFHREGLSLTGTLQVDFVTATLGGDFAAKVLGRDLQVRIPPNAEQGSMIRLPGHGLSDGSGTRGDLRLRLVLAMPPAVVHLTHEQRHLFREMFADAARRAHQPPHLAPSEAA